MKSASSKLVGTMNGKKIHSFRMGRIVEVCMIVSGDDSLFSQYFFSFVRWKLQSPQ